MATLSKLWRWWRSLRQPRLVKPEPNKSPSLFQYDRHSHPYEQAAANCVNDEVKWKQFVDALVDAYNTHPMSDYFLFGDPPNSSDYFTLHPMKREIHKYD